MKNSFVFILFTVVLLGCSGHKNTELQTGVWRATMQVQDNELLPFNFKVVTTGGKTMLEVYNAEEVLKITEISFRKDSIFIDMPVFEGVIKGVFSETQISGVFEQADLGRSVVFEAYAKDADRFKNTSPSKINVAGVWEVNFSPNTPDSYPAKGIFKQVGNTVTGTFRTETGDYRYLEGVVSGNELKLSTFDGAHVFLFLARLENDVLSGVFYSGKHFKEPFVAKRNSDFDLISSDSLTYLKEGFKKLNFSFPNDKGVLVSLDDAAYQNKVVIVQIMGTWCPNCLDETKFLTSYLKENANPNLKVISLAFEYAKTPELAFKRIAKLRKRLQVPYPILLAQYNGADKGKAQEKLPMLNHVLSYPTAIFIDKKGTVRKIHTGFNGPATGEKYVEFTTEFESFVAQLLSEN
mgnify:CR=1 FL=1